MFFFFSFPILLFSFTFSSSFSLFHYYLFPLPLLSLHFPSTDTFLPSLIFSLPFPSLPFPSPPFLSLKSCSFILLRIDISHSLSNPFLLLLLLLLLFLKDVTSVQPKGYPESLVTSITVSLSGLFIDLTHAKILSKICLFFTV